MGTRWIAAEIHGRHGRSIVVLGLVEGEVHRALAEAQRRYGARASIMPWTSATRAQQRLALRLCQEQLKGGAS
jgi:hypothetical protein